MKKPVNKPKKGAAKKWAEHWKRLREQPPDNDLIDVLNKKKSPDDSKKVAIPRTNKNDVEL